MLDNVSILDGQLLQTQLTDLFDDYVLKVFLPDITRSAVFCQSVDLILSLEITLKSKDQKQLWEEHD